MKGQDREEGGASTGEDSAIRWPERFHPDRAPIHVRNELALEAPPEVAWAWLVRASDWPRWYPNARRVRIGGGADRLFLNARFTWSTFGVSLYSRVEEFEAAERLAWSAVGWGVDVYHAWLIEPRSRGCWVLTEETQYGWATRLGNLLMPSRMSRGHQMWLERLAHRASGGMPPELG